MRQLRIAAYGQLPARLDTSARRRYPVCLLRRGALLPVMRWWRDASAGRNAHIICTAQVATTDMQRRRDSPRGSVADARREHSPCHTRQQS